jgi:zinc D-Ala-D-Ala carboxypeptidase
MPTIMLSPHFSYQELTYSETASREGLSNRPDAAALENLRRLALVLEEVRHICGDNPVTITSGYRAPEVNAACGGSSTSAHMAGLAADFIIPGFGDPIDVCIAIEPYIDVLRVDQLINEYPQDGWIHLGLSEGEPRCQCLTITNAGTTEGSFA